MKPRWRLYAITVLALAGGFDASGQERDSAAASADELVGLWRAEQRFGPDARGPLVLERTPSGWVADFMGRVHDVHATDAMLSFELPDDAGSFLARMDGDKPAGTARWTTSRSKTNGSRYATPVRLEADGANRWRGDIVPRDDGFTLYLMVAKRPDGTIGAFLRNPERNIGVFSNIDRLERSGDTVRLVGRVRGEKSDSILFTAQFDRENGILSVPFPNRGGTYDFRRDPDPDSGFFPRGREPQRYVYRPPLARDDGWPTAAVADVGIDRDGIERLVQMIVDMPIDSVHTPEIHGLLIARHGKLVLEEYFHGEHRDKLHETRSAAKSLTSTLVGAAIESGMSVGLSTPVYATMFGGHVPPDTESRKRAMTLEHLLTMRSGYFCDDSNPDAPGNEVRMLDQEDEPDYYRFTLRLPLDRDPGARSVYCSIDPNLALGVLERATGEAVIDVFERLLRGPLQIATYAWPLSPAGQPYGGGGVQFLPRDFMKLGQLMLNGGTWQGRRILDREFVAHASAPLHELESIRYGLLWWSIEYPYKNRTLRAFFAGGNGGQGVIVIPELDLVVATYGGNYADRAGLYMQQELTPRHILPAVREAGDDPHAPVVERDFTTPYG
jgi:CubicO group peptidase (beta-lactamase class C family)